MDGDKGTSPTLRILGSPAKVTRKTLNDQCFNLELDVRTLTLQVTPDLGSMCLCMPGFTGLVQTRTGSRWVCFSGLHLYGFRV